MTTQACTLLDIARAYWNAGLTPIPHVAGHNEPSYIDAYGSITPIAWGQYKERPPECTTVEQWFAIGDLDIIRIELLTGSAPHSKYDAPARLQILDFESADVFEAFLEDIHFNGHSDILYRCVIERTPSGGAHVGFLCQAINDKPTLKLALTKADTGRDKLLVELLQHHLCTVAPTRIAWKPDRPRDAVYRLTQGSWDHPFEISGEQRDVLLAACRLLNEVPTAIVDHRTGVSGCKNRPGDLLNEVADPSWWGSLLAKHGWRDMSRPGLRGKGVWYFQRPGKVGGTCSATYGKTGQYLYVFSSNAQPFQPDIAYSPFGAYALLEHDGDFVAAAKALARVFGSTPQTAEISNFSNFSTGGSPNSTFPTRGAGNSYESRLAATVIRYKSQLYADPYFGADERRAKGIPVAKLVQKETPHE
jgi:hypothetical protein